MVTVRERVRIFTPELQLHTRTGQGYNSASEAEARVGRPRPSSGPLIFLQSLNPATYDKWQDNEKTVHTDTPSTESEVLCVL